MNKSDDHATSLWQRLRRGVAQTPVFVRWLLRTEALPTAPAAASTGEPRRRVPFAWIFEREHLEQAAPVEVPDDLGPWWKWLLRSEELPAISQVAVPAKREGGWLNFLLSNDPLPAPPEREDVHEESLIGWLFSRERINDIEIVPSHSQENEDAGR